MLISAILSIKKPGVSIGLLISMFGLENFLQTQSAFFIDNGKLINVAVGSVVLVAAICSALRQNKKLFRISQTHALCIALFGYGFLSYFWTLSPIEMENRWVKSIPYLAIFLVLGPILAREKNAIRDGLRWTLYFGVPVMFLCAFYCEWGVRGMILAKPMIDSQRIVTESLPLAVASLASYVGVVGLLIQLKIPFSTLFRIAVLGVAIYLAFLTRSRGQVVAIVAVAATVYPISNRISSVKGVLLTVFGLSMFAATIYFIVNNLDLMRWRQERVESAMIGRSEMWFELLKYWFWTAGLPIVFGLGACSSFGIVGFYPHNLPVEILVELGLVGITIFTVIMWKSAINGLLTLQRLNDYPEQRTEIIALMGLLALSFVLCLKEGSLYTWPQLFFFAICLSQKEQERRKEIRDPANQIRAMLQGQRR